MSAAEAKEAPAGEVLFGLGRLSIDPKAMESCKPDEAEEPHLFKFGGPLLGAHMENRFHRLLARHARGDHGAITTAEAESNRLALAAGAGEVVSRYPVPARRYRPAASVVVATAFGGKHDGRPFGLFTSAGVGPAA